MSIDYNRLRELADTNESTDVPLINRIRATTDLENLAPDMARELLRLRDGVEVIRDELNYLAALLGRDTYYSQSRYVRDQAKALTGLLNGDTE